MSLLAVSSDANRSTAQYHSVTQRAISPRKTAGHNQTMPLRSDRVFSLAGLGPYTF